MTTRPAPRSFALLAWLLLACSCGSGGGSAPAAPVPPTPPTPPSPPPALLSLTTFQPAARVLGQPDFVSGKSNQGMVAAAANTLWLPSGSDPSGMFVVDAANHRVLGFSSVPTTNDPMADFVLGQTSFAANLPNQGSSTSASSLSFPHDVEVEGNTLFVVDGVNHRVLIWNTLPTTTNAPADIAIGQPNLTGSTSGTSSTHFLQPRAISVAGGRVVVSDQLNHRVLIWNSVPTSHGAAADLVLGQADFVSGLANRGLASTAADRLWNPSGVWTDGTRLAVVDQGNCRVLLWNSFPTMMGQPADLVLGQPDLVSNTPGLGASGMGYATGVDSNGIQLFVADAYNSRVLVWNAMPSMNGAPADVVLGQGDFLHGQPNDDDQDSMPDTAPSARTLDTAGTSIHMRVRVHGSRLYVSDPNNNRLVVFDG